MRRYGSFVILALALWPMAGAEEPLWMAVAPAAFHPAIEPLRAHRAAEGFATHIATPPVDTALDAAPRSPDFLLLVGDADEDPAEAPWEVPPVAVPFHGWSSRLPETIPSDMAWADRDRDGFPDFPVGRLSARDAETVATVAAKIVAYETRPPTLSDLRFLVWGGVPDFGEAIDSRATAMLLRAVEDAAPAWAEPWLLAADTKHALCGWPPDQPAYFNTALKQGARLAVFIGHGCPSRLHAMRYQGNVSVGYTGSDTVALAEGPPVCPLIVSACSVGRFVWTRPCLAETLLSRPGGPVAVVAATVDSHPLPNYLMAMALPESISGAGMRIGTLWLETERRAAAMRSPLMEPLLIHAVADRDKDVSLDDLKTDHRFMYAIFGDPATALRFPRPLEAKVVPEEDGWQWEATPPETGRPLHVGWRPYPHGMDGTAYQTDAPSAVAALEAANAALAYRPIEAPEAPPWTGRVTEEGRLRLAVIGAHDTYVAAFDLRREEEE